MTMYEVGGIGSSSSVQALAGAHPALRVGKGALLAARTQLAAPGLTTRSKKLLIRNKGHRY